MNTIEARALAAAKTTAPHTSILSPSFVYVPAAATNIAETFKRIRAQQQAEQAPNVTRIRKVSK